MNRRDFFLLRSPEELTLELSCEELHMRYLDSQLDGTRNQFLERTRKEFRNRRKIRLYDSFWLDQGVCRKARIVLGAVAPIPWQLPHVERMLVDQRITTELAGNAGQAAVSQAQPLAKNGYKIPLTEALVRRTLLSLAG